MSRSYFSKYRTRLTLLAILTAGVLTAMLLVYFQDEKTQPPAQQPQSTKPVKVPVEPGIATAELASGLSNPWDMAFLPEGALIFNERSGRISILKDGQKKLLADINDVYAVGEGGLTGMALDSDFAKNRYIYTCFNARTAGGLDVRLVRWKLSADSSSLGERKDIITGIPANASGRHSGCRVRVDMQGNLWVGTGDAAVASNPQNPKSLGGKILHVNRDGMPVGTSLPAPFDPRVFSYGHRNVQGLVLFDQPVDGVYGYSVEHGSDQDDEINLLKPGNFGWAPKVTYVERGIPMTDLVRFPEAVPAVWSSGGTTIAPSGVVQLSGERWGTWSGAMAMAVLKGKHIRIVKFDSQYKVTMEKVILTEFGRVRSTALGPDGSLYISTDNGTNDKIIKVTPTGN